jgi:hypothetical protein
MNKQKRVEVYRAKDSPQAHLLQSALEEAGIRAAVEGDLLQGALGEIPVGWSTAPRIIVEESDAATARQILERLERSDLAAKRERSTSRGRVGVWVFEDNLRPFLKALGWVVGYSLDPGDWEAIAAGVRETDAEAERWYDYEFAGKSRTAFSLARDPESCVVQVRVTVPVELEPQVRLAADIFARFRVRE